MATDNVTTFVRKLLKAGKTEGEHKAEFMAMVKGMNAEQLDAHAADCRAKIKAEKGYTDESRNHALGRISTYASLYRKEAGFPSKRAAGAGPKKKKEEKAEEAEPVVEVEVELTPIQVAEACCVKLLEVLPLIGRSEREKLMKQLNAQASGIKSK